MNNSSTTNVVQTNINALFLSLSNHYAGLALLYGFASGKKRIKSVNYAKDMRHPDFSHTRLQSTVSNIKSTIINIEKELQFLLNIVY